MNKIFELVYKFLKWISEISGFTYHEVNIIAYYIFIPAIFILLMDRFFKTKIFKICFGIIVVITLILVPDFEKFSTLIFNKSVDFLNWFNIIGLNYMQASVVICVAVPIMILVSLLYMNRIKKRVSYKD